ncbi:hypothetical protein M406DRAFT_330688 [Cryphonectria parasitica EP155]|uniref:Uncharacterized protein n=1 Tax=Cryphonectria parasitica (strain ATCC 38755 / EP155) TaxID=660469 RepID=A0A9P5CMG0_CRYP1|nr:uncharacterized protein M406DRAFT_330688 [Cryphonectria parasitica EP155]KAF3764344.1 hypothetical protein M406DRAFT_330688 [Cryphonectria parasitica EP155]
MASINSDSKGRVITFKETPRGRSTFLGAIVPIVLKYAVSQNCGPLPVNTPWPQALQQQTRGSALQDSIRLQRSMTHATREKMLELTSSPSDAVSLICAVKLQGRYGRLRSSNASSRQRSFIVPSPKARQGSSSGTEPAVEGERERHKRPSSIITCSHKGVT